MFPSDECLFSPWDNLSFSFCSHSSFHYSHWMVTSTQGRLGLQSQEEEQIHLKEQSSTLYLAVEILSNGFASRLRWVLPQIKAPGIIFKMGKYNFMVPCLPFGNDLFFVFSLTALSSENCQSKCIRPKVNFSISFMLDKSQVSSSLFSFLHASH